jgi:transposase
MRRYEISEDEWEIIKEVFPARKSQYGRPNRSDFEIFNGILWTLFSGASWRDVPERYGPWQTVYDRYVKWKDSGVFDKALSLLHLKLDKKGLLDYSKWMMDSTTARAHKSAAGATKKNGRRTQ